MLLLLALVGCTPTEKGYDAWPEPTEVYPWVYTPEDDLLPYEEVRWETESWDPTTDTEQIGFYLRKALEHRPGAPEESLAHFQAMRDTLADVSPASGGVSLSFVGDVMWMGENWATFALPSAHLLDGDLRIGNLETPTDPGRPTEDLGLYTFNAPPEMLDGLPLDVVQLNNNHSLDVDDAGLEATTAEVEARGLSHTGIDRRGTFTSRGGGVAVLSYTWGVNRRDITSAHDLNIIPFGHLDLDLFGPELDALGVDITEARTFADTVVVLVHWGYEYEYYPDPHFMQLGRRMVELGADVIVGQGPHVAQPAELCHVNDPAVVPGVGTCSVRTEDGEPRTAAILYSLGNFGTTMPTLPCQAGIVATVTVDPDVTSLGWAAAVTVDGEAGLEVLPLADVLDDEARAAEAERLDAHLGVGWKR